MTDLALYLGILITLINAVISYYDRKLIRKLRSLSAYNADDAVAIIQNGFISKWRLQRFLRLGIIKTSSAELFYLDIPHYRILQKRRRTRLVFILFFVIILFLIFQIAGL
ncbi:MAG: hypothetical protein JW996_01530 [Candidatus Cloacimonetes bacterium]|nr:hypothetical protein [Candidatus Cloacimonadota bacterium]